MADETTRTGRDRRADWARPGSARDRRFRWLRIALPMAVGGLGAILALSPLAKRDEVSFVLNKDKVERAGERMRVGAATYRGEDDRGQAFAVRADAAVQPTSKSPVVQVTGLSASLALKDGETKLVAPRARYDTDSERLGVDGPLNVEAANGYTLATSNVSADLNTRQVTSNGRVEGRMPLGTFSAGRMSADLGSQTVKLEGRARLHIDQGAAKARR